MKQYFILSVLISAILIACKTNPKRAVADFKPDKRLLTHSKKIVYTVDSLEWLKKEQLDKISSSVLSPQIDTVKYLENKIYISCLRLATGCGEYAPNIKFVGDTIKLDMHLLNDVVCTEQNAWRVTYWIENKSGKKYKVQKYL
jgi:hypothetical protein